MAPNCLWLASFLQLCPKMRKHSVPEVGFRLSARSEHKEKVPLYPSGSSRQVGVTSHYLMFGFRWCLAWWPCCAISRERMDRSVSARRSVLFTATWWLQVDTHHLPPCRPPVHLLMGEEAQAGSQMQPGVSVLCKKVRAATLTVQRVLCPGTNIRQPLLSFGLE